MSLERAAAPPPRAAPAVAVRGLQLAVRGHFWRARRHVLRGVDLAVGVGEGVAFVGHNGAGKTTVLRVLLGLQRADAGAAHLFGVPVADPRARLGLGYLPERACYPRQLDALTFVSAHARLAGLGAQAAARAATQVLDRVGLCRDARRPLGDLSKGMVQRAGLAQALVGQPRLLVLDEPFDGLDPAGRAELRGLIAEERARGCSVLFCTHVVADVASVCDRAVVLARGRVVVDTQLATLEAHANAGALQLQVAGLPAEAWARLSALVRPAPASAPPGTFVADDLAQANAAVDLVRAAGGQLVALRPLQDALEHLLAREDVCA